MMQLSKFPRVKLSEFPTSIEKLDRLSKHLGDVNIYIKRDDLTGLAAGGNKIRKLEFLIGDALAKGADTIITQGAVQSNHVRQTVAAASKFGLKSRAILERRIQNTNDRYEKTSNILLDNLFGIDSIRYVPLNANMDKELEIEADEVRKFGGKPYVIPGGGSNALGSLGYVNAAVEILNQANESHIVFDSVVVTSGSSGTHAGLVAGFNALNSGIEVVGISISRKKEPQERKIRDEADKIADFISIPKVADEKIIVNSDYVGAGYGILNEEALEAISLCAKYEGLLLDPVYTGKAFAGMIGLIRKGYFKKGANILFIHTGGAMALFAYEDEIMDYLASKKSS
jgi:L-cysteate sulfo-lyase